METKNTCKMCKWLDVKPDKIGRIIVRNAGAYRCMAPVPEYPKLPISITESYGWRWPPSRRYMTQDDGEGCLTYVLRNKESNASLSGPNRRAPADEDGTASAAG